MAPPIFLSPINRLAGFLSAYEKFDKAGSLVDIAADLLSADRDGAVCGDVAGSSAKLVLSLSSQASKRLPFSFRKPAGLSFISKIGRNELTRRPV